MKPDLFWVETNLATMARPRGGDWLDDEMSGLAREVDVLVSLLTDEEERELDLVREAEAARASGIEFQSFAIPDRGVPESPVEFAKLARQLAAQFAAGKRIAVHCRMGLGRSSMLAASVLACGGLAVDAAFARIRAARKLDVPDTKEQRRFVELLSLS